MKLKQLAMTALFINASLIGATAHAGPVSNTYALNMQADGGGGLSAVFGKVLPGFEFGRYFTDTFTFTATTPFEYAGSLTSLYQTYSDDFGHRVTKHVSIEEFSLYTYDTVNHMRGTLVAKGTLDSGGKYGSTTPERWSFSGGWNQAPGDYAVYVAGSAYDKVGGTYAADFSILAVPEPETWAMLVAGLGLVGFSARRRAKG